MQLERSTARGAKHIFVRFVAVVVGLNMIAGATMLVYDLYDSAASTRDHLEQTASLVVDVAGRMHEAEPEVPSEQLLQRVAHLTGMPLALISKQGQLEFATSATLTAQLPLVFGGEPIDSSRVRIRKSMGDLSGGWIVRDFGPSRRLLVVVPHLPEDEGNLLYVTLGGGVLALGLLASFFIMLGAANWMLRRPLSGLVSQLTGALARDVERRREAELVAVAARMDAEEHLAFRDNLINAATQLGIVATDAGGRIQIINQAAERLLGLEAVDVVGRMSLEQLWERTSRQATEQVPLRDLIQTSPTERYLVDSAGREHLVDMATSDIVDAEGHINGRLVLFLDVTERKRLEVELQINELQLIQHAKLASLGEMATGIAHELNQPLNNIALLASRIRRRLPAEQASQVHDKLDKIQGQVQRASRIIDQLRTFGQPRARQLSRFAVARAVDSALELMGDQLSRGGIEVQTVLPPDLPLVEADEPQLEQVLVNLLLNARDALQENPEGKPRWVRISAEPSVLQGDRPAVSLHVADSGPGIDPKLLSRVFEPFFTTKDVGKGTGLGLSISYGLVQGFGGRLQVRSESGVGCTFSIVLRAAHNTELEQPKRLEAEG